ncbi:DNA methyltransferase [Treponema endosymbiont of Eucomonympha sp.]|uniref:DNA methyltransferase n=1 Tax=Treponema endosymbiont of Eucomonympha sp. TaxID=1580831 RepID=UPI000ACEE16D|nr:DNA methyltransferase [Treponema endosymbiont of Eucomonympha sp.]
MENLESNIISRIFDQGIELLGNVNELFELELAFLEYKNLPREQLLDRTAFIKSIDGKCSHHFLMCSVIPDTIQENRTSATRAYFAEGQFSTGYATHGLFPYRGKFHPQLIKALLNIFNIQKNETVLDPMAGSGTTNIEASLMGINSLALDISPFCQFMIKTKYDSLTIDRNIFLQTNTDTEMFFNYLSSENSLEKIKNFGNSEKENVYSLALLAYLDALGYSKRVVRSNHRQLFDKVLPRYIETMKTFLQNPYFEQENLGNVTVIGEDALKTDLPDESVDCIITSPPYSFAIDYVENDRDQLEFFGVDIDELKKNMIGLKGDKKNDKIENYFDDIEKLCAEMSRVLKTDKYFTVIIGSNTNQTGGIRLESSVIAFSQKYGMPLVKMIQKPIRGMRNTMKDEYILIFRKVK